MRHNGEKEAGKHNGTEDEDGQGAVLLTFAKS